MIGLDPHPSAFVLAFTTEFPAPLGGAASPAWLLELLREGPNAPVARTEELRSAVRDMLRHGGYKPTGRGKPSCEYLVRAAAEGGVRSINPAVDACNAVSLHSGLPISLVDLDRTGAPLRIGLGTPGSSYVFNASGQVIDVSGLLCLHDAAGPCANAVKDAERTKTRAETTRTLSVVWGARGHEEASRGAEAWYREILGRLGARTEEMGRP